MTVTGARRCPTCDCDCGRRIWSEDGYRYLRCVACHTVWSDISGHDYAAVRHNVWDEETVEDLTTDFYGRARERAHDEFFTKIAPRPGRVLDVGCGLGYFLARAQIAGWQVRGCDTSAGWVSLTNELLGFPAASVGRLDAAIGAEERFDLITAWDVVEHIHEPIPFLRAMASRLAADGRIFLRTPNLAYVLPVYALRRGIGHDVRLGPTNHVVYFTAASMRRTLRAAGLEPVQWPVLAPPQVETFAAPAAAPGAVVRLKNGYARLAQQISRVTRGRMVVGADLDVVARLRNPL